VVKFLFWVREIVLYSEKIASTSWVCCESCRNERQRSRVVRLTTWIRLGSKIRSRKSGSCQTATESFLIFSERYQRGTWSWDQFQDTAIGLGKKMFDS
jgi:uncharacterized protein YaeQ